MALVEVEVASLIRKCRFCLTDLTKNDRVLIDYSLKEKFESITQTELKKSTIYSKFICSLCNEHFDFSYNFICKLIEQQKHCLILEESLRSSDPKNVKLEIEEIVQDVIEEDEYIVEEEAREEFLKEEYLEEEVGGEYGDYQVVVFQSDTEADDSKSNITYGNISNSFERKKYIPDKGHIVACSECEVPMRKDQYEQHVKQYHPSMRGTYVCDICSSSFPYKSRLKRHLPTHFGKTDCFTCARCQKSFPMQGLLKDHIYKYHTIKIKEEKIYECEHCDRSFRSQGGKVDHEKTIHLGIREFICNYPGCGIVFTNRQKLNVHKLYHKNEEHICPYPNCFKIFLSTSMLNKHKLHHEKPFKCDQCPREFPSNAKLVYHVRSFHDKIMEVCEMCGKSFGHKISLDQHIAITHNNYKMFCAVPGCSSSFGRRQHYMRHLKRLHPDLDEESRREILQSLRSLKNETTEIIIQNETI